MIASPAVPAELLQPSASSAETGFRAWQSPDRLLLALLCAFTLTLGVLKGSAVPLWSDELATVHIALAPTWLQTLQVSHAADLNPPLEPLLVRLSFSIFGPHEFGARLPSILCFTIAVSALFIFLRRRMPASYAAVGALIPLCNNEIRYYLTEARPYAVLLAAAAVGVVAYDSILARHRPRLSRTLLALAILAMLQAHIFGSLAALAFVLAEAVRTLRTRRLDTWTALAVLAPWLSCLSYLIVLHSQAAAPALIYSDDDRTSLHKGLLFYHHFLYLPLSGLLKVFVVGLLCVPFFPHRSLGRVFRLLPETWALLLALLASPVLITLAFALRGPLNGFFPRYAIAAVVPACLLLALLVAWRAGAHRVAGVIFATAAFVLCLVALRDEPWHVRRISHDGLLSAPPDVASTAGVATLCPALPLVMNNPHDFMEADFRLGPHAEQRMVYVTSRSESLRLEHESAGEAIEIMASAFHLAHQVVPAASFLPAHPQFLLLSRAHHHNWLFDDLAEHHATLQPLGARRFAGEKDELWFVSQDPAASPPSCLSGAAHL